MTGHPVPEQVEAFCDTWTLTSEDIDKLRMIRPTLESYGLEDSIINFWDNWLRALRDTNDKLLSYLFYMMERLFEMRRILKPTGSIYLHCDSTASHYIKVMMDGIFGHKNFRNEIIWYYPNKIPDTRKKLFTKSNDTILFYAKNFDKNFYFQYQEEKRDKPVKQARIKKVNGQKICVKDDNGKCIYDIRTTRVCDNVWKIPMLTGSSERLGYPTQKPILLLERIINASCQAGGGSF